MKCILNDKEIFELSPTQMNLLGHIIPINQIEDHVTGLIHYIIGQKLREAAQKLFEEWKPKLLKEGVSQVPLMDIDLAKMIFEHPEYKSAAVDNGNSDAAAPSTLPPQ